MEMEERKPAKVPYHKYIYHLICAYNVMLFTSSLEQQSVEICD